MTIPEPDTICDPLWKRATSFPVLLAFIIAAAIYAFATRGIADPDIWWHLRNAETLVRTGSMVRQDTYSFTVHGARWINHEWLSELPYYFGWRWFGPRGLYFVLVAAVETILMGVFYLSYLASRNIKATFLASFAALYLATVSFGPRTLLFGWILLVVELIILEQYKAGKNYLWLLPLTFAVWVNIHGSWLIGLVLLAVFITSGAISGEWGRVEAKRWSPAQARNLLATAAASMAALFLNPYGYRLVFYPFDLAFRQKENVAHVQEWHSLDLHSLRGKIIFGMLAAILVLALTRRRRWRVDEALFVLIAFYSAFIYSRFLFLAAIVVTPILAKELSFISPYQRETDKRLLNALVMIVVIGYGIWKFPTPAQLMQATSEEYPAKALSYLQQFRPEGRVFNDYLWGGYLIWNVRHVPVFVDSRVDIYEYAGVFHDYLDAISVKGSFEILDKYHIRYVLFSKATPIVYLLRHSTGWKTDYDDGTTILFERIGQTP